jgi:hypothetical protein
VKWVYVGSDSSGGSMVVVGTAVMVVGVAVTVYDPV